MAGKGSKGTAKPPAGVRMPPMTIKTPKPMPMRPPKGK